MRLQRIIIISLLLLSFTSCASSDWRHAGVAPHKRTWRFCTKEYDGDRAGTGYCYWDLYWKWKIWAIDKEYKRVHLYCKFGDIKCFIEHKIYPNMVLSNKK